MFKPIRTLTLAACFLCIHTSYAQKSWTLQECISYAIDHNIELQKQAQVINQREIQLKSAKYARLPQLWVAIDNDFTFHQNLKSGILSSEEGPERYSNTMNLTGGLNATVPICDRRLTSQTKVAYFNLESALALQDKAMKDIGIQIAVQYLNILYQQGLEKVCRRRVELSGELVRKTEKQFTEGVKPQSEVVQAKAQLAADEYQLSVTLGDRQMCTIKLAQMLMLEDVSSFRVYDSSLDTVAMLPQTLQPAHSLIQQAVDNYPGILAAKASISAAEANVKVEKSRMFPTLQLVGSIGTQGYRIYNDQYSRMLPDFSRQFENNTMEVVGLSLKIPIFSAMQTRSAVNLAKSQVEIQKLNLLDQRLQLRTEIEQAYYNAIIALSRYQAAQKAELSSQMNYDYQLKSYEAGKTTIFDLNIVNQQWLKAQQDVLQSKYEYLIRLKILDFYISDSTI